MEDNQGYLLWGFVSNEESLMIITRGRTHEEAWIWASFSFKQKDKVYLATKLPIKAAKMYNINHPFDWLHTPPLWLQEFWRTGKVLNHSHL